MSTTDNFTPGLQTQKEASPEHKRQMTPPKATPHDHRLMPLYAIYLQIFRHITQILLVLRQQDCVAFGQSDEKSDGVSDIQWSCGIALSYPGRCFFKYGYSHDIIYRD